MPKLALIRDTFETEMRKNYYYLCPPQESMKRERYDYHEYLTERTDIVESNGKHFCQYSGRLSAFQLPSGTVTHGIIVRKKS